MKKTPRDYRIGAWLNVFLAFCSFGGVVSFWLKGMALNIEFHQKGFNSGYCGSLFFLWASCA